jgi:alkanesulfonate monooxygenase SsuD/methylene tetrahydromethanopterin reductase-like flavin-dependent oxidoreductase (luciferase family)
MSATQVVTVPVTQATYERLSRRASQEGRSVAEVLEDTVAEADRLAEERRVAFQRMGEAIRSLQDQSIINGTSNMTMDEINEEIALMHREQAEQRKSA